MGRRMPWTKTIVVASCVTATAVCQAAPLFPAGTESKAAGLESSLRSEGPPAVLYNPANLSLTGKGRSEPYAELGLINVQYTYEHPEFDPVTIAVTSPTATLGYSAKPLTRLTVSGVVFPSKTGKTEIPGLPRKVGSAVTAVDVTSEDQVIDVALGAAYKLAKSVSLGLSLVHTIESHTLHAALIGSESDLVETSYRNQFTRPVLGARFGLGPLVELSLAVKPALEKTYEGEHSAASQDGESGPKVVDFEPETVAIGVGTRFRRATLGVEAIHERWSKGRGIVRNAVTADEPDADLSDVTQLGLNASYRLAQGAELSAGYARIPTPWGDGRDDGLVDHHVYGVDFGQLNGVDRQVVSLGGSLKLRGYDTSLAIYRAQGERVVADGGDNVGYYSIGVTSVSGAVKASF
jgi:hypothetical protein